MTNTETIQGFCPQCGEALSIPMHLSQFSCMYCGIRLTPDELKTASAPKSIRDEDAASSAAYYRDHILSAVSNYTGLEREVTGSGYVPAYDRYYAENQETFRQLDLAVFGGSLSVEEAVSCFLEQLNTRWDTQSGNSRKYKMMSETDKLIVALYLVPMVRRMALDCSEEYCQVLHKQWMAAYPNNPFYLGTYEELTAGFRKKFLGLCYITTAVCLQDGKPDDCAELTAFRSFRDGYLRSCPDGPGLIDEYYRLAPQIVLRIDHSTAPAETYAAIREQYLVPCYQDIQQGNLRQCKERYTNMIRTLEKEYLN